MSKRVFSYPTYAEQEAESIRKLLEANHIEFFETPASRWGFTHAAIWVKQDTDEDQAKQLLEQHYRDYAEHARREYQKETGYDPQAPWPAKMAFTFQYLFRRKLAVLLLLAGVILLYLYLSMFFSLFTTQ